MWGPTRMRFECGATRRPTPSATSATKAYSIKEVSIHWSFKLVLHVTNIFTLSVNFFWAMTSKPPPQAAIELSRGSQKSADLTLFVQDMLDQMVSRYCYSKIHFQEGNGFQVLLLALFVNLSLFVEWKIHQAEWYYHGANEWNGLSHGRVGD